MMRKRAHFGSKGLATVILLGLSLNSVVGCGNDDDAGAGGKDGVAGTAGVAGNSASAGSGGEAGEGDADSAACACGVDVNAAEVPLDCACAAGLCSTYEADLTKYRSVALFGTPYYVLLGVCADGYHTLSYEEATEQGGRRTYDADGRMVYDQFSGYDGVVPAACGFDDEFSLGSVTIGTDPSRDCKYCLLAADDEPIGNGGASGAGGDGGAPGAGAARPAYPESNTPACDPSVFD